MKKTFSLDSFKEALSVDVDFKSSLAGESDVFDEENGVAVVHENNISKYLEKYMCKDQEELSDFLYYHHGIFLKIV